MRCCSVLLVALGLASVVWGQAEAPQSMKFGIRVSPPAWSDLRAALTAEPCDPSNPLGVTLTLPADWAQNPDWPAFDEAVGLVVAAHARLIVSSEIPGGPAEIATLAYLATLSEHARNADNLALVLQGEQFSETLTSDPDRLALTLKRLTATVRGESRAAVLLGEVTRDALPILKPLYARDFLAYVEGYTASEGNPQEGTDEEVTRFFEVNHPGAPFLRHLPKAKSPIAAQLLVLASASRGASFTDIEPENVASIWHSLSTLRSRLTRGMSQGYSAQATEIRDAQGSRSDVGILNFLDGDEFAQAMVLVPTRAASPPAELQVKLPTGDVSEPIAYPLPEGQKVDLTFAVDQEKGETVLKVPWQGKALLVLFSRLKTGTVGRDQVSVTGTYRVPVEFILARYQAAQQLQDIFLENYTAEARVDYHFKLPGGTGSMDVTFLNDFLFQKGRGAMWVQKEMLLNGVRWKGGAIPNLPIIEPEKVNTLPLALTIGRDYLYRYLRDEVVEGRDCFVVDFVPAPEAKGSLYSGMVWIDKETYVRRRMRVRQVGLDPPAVSNDETDEYNAIRGPDDRTFHILSGLSGQMIFSVAGTNIAAEREIRFSDIRPNAPDFSGDVKRAEATDQPILAETDEGLRYMVKEKDGSRTLQMNPPTGRWFGVAGGYYDKSLDAPLPLIGANFFDYNFKKKNVQVEMLLAGAVNTLMVAQVDIFPKVDWSANATLFALPSKDQVYSSGAEDKPAGVKILRERVSAALGWRFQEFSKLSLELGGAYYRYSRSSETSRLFRLPPDHFDIKADLGYQFSRRGWTLAADYEAHHRSAWADWGLAGADVHASQKRDYALWNATVSKSFHLPWFQKISVSAIWMDGRDLDRFSKYQFTYLGRDSLVGFAGSGVRFDRGAAARVAYDFNVANAVRFGVKVDRARVQPAKGEGSWQNHTGAGISGAITGPWKTYWTLEAGYVVQSDIPAVRRDCTVALVVLKLW